MSQPQYVAIVAPSLEDAAALARERRVEHWFYVTGPGSIHGRDPGLMLLRTVIGRPLTTEQALAYEAALRAGWRLA